MAIVTTDILLEGIRRDSAFAWLSDPGNHRLLVQDAFDGFAEKGPGDFTLTVKSGGRSREMGYRFDRADDSHGGRRVLVDTTGKRFQGHLHYSLRTMKPSSNTLVTLHVDYDPGAVLGALLDRSGMNQRLDACCRRVLENLSRVIPRT
jgi:hypothetical protein